MFGKYSLQITWNCSEFFYGFMMEFSVLLTPAHKHTQVHVPIFTFTCRKWIRVQYQTVQVQKDFLLEIY